MIIWYLPQPKIRISILLTFVLQIFIERLEKANDSDSKGCATWLLRSGMQDGDDTPSRVISIVPGVDNTAIVNWSDMGHKGSTTFTLVKSDGVWKINSATVPEGYNPL